jgi:hypothetical protein
LGEAASAAAALGMADSLPRPQESSNHFANATLAEVRQRNQRNWCTYLAVSSVFIFAATPAFRHDGILVGDRLL